MEETFFSGLVNYGALGLITCYFIYNSLTFNKKITSLVEENIRSTDNNTNALNGMKEVISKCKR